MARQSANRPTNTDISPYLLDFTGVDFGNKAPQEQQEEPGFLSKLANSGSAILEGIGMIPGGVVDTLRDAWNGGDIDVTDRAEIERRAQREREKEEYVRKYQGKTFEGIPDAMTSLPYSLGTMGASLGAGLAGTVAAGPVAGAAAGMAASGTLAYRATKEDFMRRMLDETEKALGRTPTQEEWNRIAADFDSEATQYGLWEAGPEALSNLFMAKLLGPLGSKVFKGGVGQAAKRVAGLYGEELATETATQMGQGDIEAGVGLRDQAPGAWEAFKEVAPPTFWQTTLMAGGKKAADFVSNRMRRRSDDAANNAINEGEQSPGSEGEAQQEGSAFMDEGSVQPAGPYVFEQRPENMPVPRSGAPRDFVRDYQDEMSYAETDNFIREQEEREQAQADADFLIEQGRAPSVRYPPHQQALEAGETIDLLQLPQDASGMAQGISVFGLPEGTGAQAMGTSDTGLGVIAPPTGYYEPQPIATPYQPRQALPQEPSASAGQGRWAGGRSQLSYPWPGMAQGIGGLMDVQHPEQVTQPSAMPTQSQITNTQAAPRADTTAMAEGLGMPAPEAMPQEAVQTPATDVQMPVNQQGAPVISPLQGIGGVVESAPSQPLMEASDDRGNQGPERLAIPGLQQSDGGRSSQQPIGNATGSAGGRTDESGRPSAKTSAGRNQRTIKIPNRDDERVRYEVLEADNVQSSHIPEAGFQPNPRYQLENERRYHDEPASQAKVLNNAQNLDPSFLIESVDANHGAPVIDRQDNVLGGNGRAMSVRMAYEKFPEKAAAYRGALIEQAENLGLDPEQIARMKRPVLVRRVERELGNDERQALVSALNDTFTDSKNARAAGKSRGDRLGRKTLEALARGLADANSLRDYFDQPESAEVVEMLIDDGVIQDTERNALVGKDGLLNPDGKKAVEQALRGRVARSYEALNSLPTPVLGKLDAAIPHMLIAENVGAEWNITEHVRDAIDLLAEFQASDQKAPQTFLAQQDMMKGKAPSERYSQQAQALFLMMLNAKKNAFVESFAKFAAHAKVSKGGMGIGLSATGAGKKFLGLEEAARGAEESAPSNVDKPKYAPDGTVDKDGVYIKHDGWWYTKGKDGLPKERLGVSYQQRLEEEWRESQKKDKGESNSTSATNSEQPPARVKPQPSKPAYGTVDRPDTIALSEYFADKLSTGGAFSSIVQARKEAGDLLGGVVKPGTIAAKAIDEAVELGAVQAARKTVEDMRAQKASDVEIFRALVDLYQRQPTLGTRTSTSVAQQAYSTPTPIAFLASRLAGIGKDTSVYEPTAGNGALLIEATPSRVTANELNSQRAKRLRAQGFDVTEQDATGFLPQKKVDVVIENPPFGRVWNENHTATQEMEVDGFVTKEIDQAIVVRSLQALKDKGAGRAVLIIGGKQGGEDARKKSYRAASQTKFWGWLFNHYHVLEHFSLDGKMYSRQGASFPIDVIVLDTNGSSAGRIFPGAQPPRMFTSFESLEELFNGETMGNAGLRAGGDSGSAAGLEGERGQGRHRPDDHTGVEHSEVAPTDGGRRRDPAGEQAGEAGNGPRGAQGTQRPESRPEHNGTADSKRGQGGYKDSADELQPVRQADDAVARPRVSPEDRGQRAGDVPGESGGLGNERGKLTAKKKPEQKAQKATKFQIPYEKTSTHSSLGTLVPRNMATAIRKSMAALEEAHGNIDDYVASELGYSSEHLGKYFAAEQIDAIGLAIHNLSQGAGFIIGDQTGVGKGRVNAAIIRWAKRQGLIPVFVTQKKTLYSDMVRDLADIDMGDFTPLPTDNGLVGKDAIPLPDGRTLKTAQAAKHEQVLKEAMQNGLEGYDAVFTTYSQMNANGKRPTPRRDFLSQLAPKAVFILDESHSAGGSASGSSWEAKGKAEPVSKFFRKLLQESPNGVFYSSATYAKSPNVMDLYMKTDMRHAVNDISTLGEAISRGGIPMQQVVAAELAESGQYIRRERTWEGADVETQSVKTAIKRADACADALHCIMLFDRAKQKAVKDANEAAAQSGGLAYDNRAANEDAIKSTNFTSIMHNLIAQSLLAKKVDAIIDQADAALKRGEKPVITLANTMEASISEYAKDNGLSPGDPVGLSFKDLFLRYLHKARQVTKKDNDGNIIESRPLTDAELGSRAVRLFKEAETIINKSGLDDLEVSFIDLIEDGLRKRGYSVGEITGRGTGIDYSGDTPVLYTRKSSNAEKARVIDGFNNGSLDAVILNSSGSTGISLHASERFKDQRRRTMIIAQPDLNIDVFMQTLGRIFRTGQVVPPKYVLLFTDIPAEKRPAAVLAKKMASLNANTTAAKDSDASFKNVPDFLNKYGDRVAMQVVNENEELHDRMGNPLDGMEDNNEGAMKRLTGYIPLLPVQDQARLYDLLESEYNELIAQEEALGTLDMEAKSLPLDAVLEREEEIAGKKDVGPSNSPFTSAAKLGTYNVKRLGRPFPAEKVREMVKAGSAVDIEEQEGRFEDWLTERLKPLSPDSRGSFEERSRKTLDSFKELARLYRPGVPLAIENGRDGSRLLGMVTNVCQKGSPDNPLALSTWKVEVAVADASKKLVFPFSQMSNFDDTGSAFLPWDVSEDDVYAALDSGQSDSREQVHIATGNILAAYERLGRGKVVQFEDHEGNIIPGIMLPKGTSLNELLNDIDVPLTPAQAMEFLSKLDRGFGAVKTEDKNFVLSRNGEGTYTVAVPAAKAKGAMYYLNGGILKAAGKDFAKAGNSMVLKDLSEQKARAILEVMSSQGFGLVADNNKEIAKEISGLKKEADEAGQSNRGAQKNDVEDVVRLDYVDGNGKSIVFSVSNQRNGRTFKGYFVRTASYTPQTGTLVQTLFENGWGIASDNSGKARQFATKEEAIAAAEARAQEMRLTRQDNSYASIRPGEFLRWHIPTEGVRAETVRRVVSKLGENAKNAAESRVVQTFDELPENIRRRYASEQTALEGVFDPSTGQVWFVADNIADAGRAAEVWAHEQIVHNGLRGMLSEAERRGILNRLWLGMGGMGNARIRQVARTYGLNPRANEADRLTVMEEVVAAMAEKRRLNDLTRQELSLWKRIVRAVARAWERIVRTASGRNSAGNLPDVDGLLKALGRYVMDGIPPVQRANEGPLFASKSDGLHFEAEAAWTQLQRDMAEWERQVDAAHEGTLHPRQVLTVGRTPHVLQKLGAPDLAMTMTQNVLRKIGEGGKHDLPEALIRRLPALLAEPVMVFRSATQANSLVALLEATHDGMPVVAAVHLDVDQGSVNINSIASVHGRSGGLEWVAGEIRSGRRVYADKTKIPAWTRGLSGDAGSRRMSGLQSPGAFVLPNDPRGVKVLTEADVVKPIAPEGEGRESAPLASLTLSGIMRVGTKRAATLADAPEIQHLFRKSDLTFMQSIVQLPHWIAKQAKEFATIYDRQLQRMDERSAALKRSLEAVPSLFGKSRLSGPDLESLKKLLWEIEGRETWQEHVSGVDKFVTKEVLASGRETIEVNPRFYDVFKIALDAADATPRAKEAMLEIRKSLDNDLVTAHNRMASMSEMSDDAIREFRQSIGHVPNYFPHHRYGAYFVQAKVDGEVVFRQHFDAVNEKAAMAKARKIAKEQRDNYPGATWLDGKNDRLPDEILGAPIDSEAMEQIIRAATSKIGDKERAREIGDLLTEGVADVLKSRGWGSHGIQRKGTPGFETDDIARVLYDYKAGLNGWLTKMEAARDFSDALSKIDARKKPNLWKYASQYTKDMLRNSDRVDRITGNIKAVAFAWYLGGSIKTAVVNATQNLVVGVPRLQMDVTGGGLMWLKGAQDALVNRVTGNKGRGLSDDEARLIEELYGESVITDAFMEEVRGHLSGVTGATLWNKFTKLLGLPMSEIERFNRASLALAAYRAARSGKLKEKAKGKYGIEGKATYEQAKEFASEVVRDAHFVYGKSNMPEFMRSNTAGRALASMYTFRTFSHNMLAMWAWALKTQGREGAAFCAKSIGATMALGGVTALPLYATLMALFQAVTGDDDDWTETIRNYLPQNNLLRDAVCYGAPAIAGVSIGGSLKMETPLTKGLTKGKNPKEVLTDSIGDIIGIPYDLGIVKVSNMMDAQAQGNYWRMIEEAMPTFVKNGMQAWRLYSEGQTTMRGRPINSPGKEGARKLSGAEAVGKALGFQPVSSTKSYDAYAASKRRDEVRSAKLDDLTLLALKTHDTGDPSGRMQAIKEIEAWNAKMRKEGKPQMTISLQDVMRRVKARRRQNRVNGKQREKGARQAEIWGV